MISLISYGHFHLVINHKCFQSFNLLVYLWKIIFPKILKAFNVRMVLNIIMFPLKTFVTKTEWHSFFLPLHIFSKWKSERKIRTINNLVWTLLAHSSMPPKFWHHALQMATYLLNIIPRKVLSNYSPTQILYHRTPIYKHLKVFGCLCYPLFPSTTIHKLQYRSIPCIFLGYPSNHRGYKCYDISAKKIILSHHVRVRISVFQNTKIILHISQWWF